MQYISHSEFKSLHFPSIIFSRWLTIELRMQYVRLVLIIIFTVENNGLQCHHCNKRYMKRRILLEHLLRVHFMDKENRPRYPCDLCEKTYTEKSAVRSHKKTAHFGLVKHIQEHVCTVCGKSQKGKYALGVKIDIFDTCA